MSEALEETTPGSPFAIVELLDPEKITPRNNRNARLNDQFLNSIRELGVLQPIRVIRDPDGGLTVRFGDRRRLACIQLGIQVPAIIIDADAGSTDAEIDRIFEQLAENDARDGITSGERAAAVQDLLDLKVPAKIITRKTGLGKDEIAAARRIAASETARTLAEQYPLDLEQTAAIAEFDGDDDTVKSLAEAAAQGPGRFRHVLEGARTERADQQLLDAHAAGLTGRGITVTRNNLRYENAIQYWADADGTQLTPETHQDCPGSIVGVYVNYQKNVIETWYCSDPKGNGHKQYRNSGSSSQSPEEASAERTRVLAGNRDWRSAETVRRGWLRDLLARPKIPDGALLYVLQEFARSDSHLRYVMDHRSGGQHVMARELLGLARDKGPGYSAPPEVHTAMAKASPARAQVIALAIIVGANETFTTVQSWRSPSADTADYLDMLAGWGYELSDIERELVADVRKRQTEIAAAVKADGED